MAYMDKVDAFILAIQLDKSGDKNNRDRIDNLINKSVEREKRNNTYSETIYVGRADKKLLKICD